MRLAASIVDGSGGAKRSRAALPRAQAISGGGHARDDAIVPVICPTCQNVFRGTFKAQSAPRLSLHGVVFDILVWRGPKATPRPQRSGFFSSEKRSGSRPIDGCSIGASVVRAAGRSLMLGSL